MKRLLIIERDDCIIRKKSTNIQFNGNEKFEFKPEIFYYLGKIARESGFELIMLIPGKDTIDQNQIVRYLKNEAINFNMVMIDANHSTPEDETGLILKKYKENPLYDLSGSFVVGKNETTTKYARLYGTKSIVLNNDQGDATIEKELEDSTDLYAQNWSEVYYLVKSNRRKVVHLRNTSETKIMIELNIDGEGNSTIDTGLGFFDHMLTQIAKHGQMDLAIKVTGDLHIDEHHTIEDTGIALGEAFAKALEDKRGMERYGFALPMDDAEAKILLDFGGRSWIVWNVDFRREKIGDMPTEMFFHFFKSFSDAAKCNLNIECRGSNEHHKIEAIFKAFAKAIRMAVKKDPLSNYLPTTKGII